MGSTMALEVRPEEHDEVEDVIVLTRIYLRLCPSVEQRGESGPGLFCNEV